MAYPINKNKFDDKKLYHFKSYIRKDLLNISFKLNYLLSLDDAKGFSYGSFSSLIPLLFRLYSHMWCKRAIDLLKLRK